MSKVGYLISTDAGFRVIRFYGDLDLSRASEVREALTAADGISRVIIDFTGVEYLDSVTLSALVQLHRKRDVRGLPPPALAGLSRNLQRLFRITSLDQMWVIYDSFAEARAAMSPPDYSRPAIGLVQ